MFARIERSWDLVCACTNLLLADKSLLVFPLLSAVSMVLVVITFCVPLLAMLGILWATHIAHTLSTLSYVALFAFYWLQFTVVIFFNAALVAVALRRMDGQPATIKDGLRCAWSRLTTILVYALMASTVGVVLRIVFDRVNLLGQIVVAVLGFAWSVATVLVVPVLVVEKVGPFELISRSTQVLTKTWGELIIGNIGIGIVFSIVHVLLVLFGLMAIAIAGMLMGYKLALLVLLVVILLWVLLVLVQSTLQGIYEAALYRYATGSGATVGIDTALLHDAFRRKP